MNWGMMSRAERDAALQQFGRGQEQPGAQRSAHRGLGRLPASPCRSISTLRYGPKERNTWDLFPSDDPNAPCIVFIHGGYWQRNSKDQFASMIAGPFAHGWAAALPGYTLAARASLSEIVAEIDAAPRLAGRETVRHAASPGKVVLSGWSGRRPSDGAMSWPCPRERRPFDLRRLRAGADPRHLSR